MSAKNHQHGEPTATELLTTFAVGNNLFGIEVMRVQEVTGQPVIIPVPLAPKFVQGLINLRGQLATALGMKELFGSESSTRLKIEKENQMSVVCRIEGNLVSLLVDSIGDVVEADSKFFEATPDTIPAGVRPYIKGIYKMKDSLLSILDLDKLANELSPKAQTEVLTQARQSV